MRKHRVLLSAVFAAAGLLLLTACTSSEDGIAQNVSLDQGGGTGTADAGAGDSGGTRDNAGQEQMQDGAGQEQAPAESGQAETTAQTQSAAQAESDGSAETQATELPTEEPGGTAAVEDIWSGTYVSDQETVTIALIDAGSFSFSFANAGIASTAVIDGYQAVYRGDDHHVVVFEVNGDIMNITVSSEEDFDASASPVNGTYVRE